MPIEFQVSNESGQGGEINLNEIIGQLRKNGYNPHGYTADGMTLTLDDGKGPYQVKTVDALNDLGWNIVDAKPQNADYSAVSPQWRAAITALPNDDTRRAYVEGQLKRLGHEDPQVMGQGKSWYAFNPGSNQWVALTNQPGIGMSDVAGIAAQTPRFFGSLAGGAAGGLAGLETGPGAILAAGAGAGLGGGAADTATRALLAKFDPELSKVMGENMGDVAKDVGLDSALDAVTMGGAKFLGPITKGLINRGPISSLARGVGATSEKMGEATSKVSRLLGGVGSEEMAAGERAAAQGGAGRQVAHAFTGPRMRQDITGAIGIPGVSAAQGAAFAAQTPSFITRSLLDAGESLGKSQWARNLFPGTARGLRQFTGRLSRGTGAMARPERAAEEMAAAMGGEKAAIDKSVSMRDVFGNLGERAGTRTASHPTAVYRNTISRALEAGRPYSEAMELGEQAAKEAEKDIATRAIKWRRGGQAVGDVMDSAERIGEGVLAGTRAVTRTGLRAAGAAGRIAQHGGRALKLGGRVAQPIENRAYMRYGAEEALGPDYERLDPWSRPRPRATVDEMLATD